MRRWILQIAATGAGSLLLLITLVWLRADKIIGALAVAVTWVGRPIADWIEATWPSKESGWPKGIATPLMVDAALIWITLWLALLVAVRLLLHFKEKQETR